MRNVLKIFMDFNRERFQGFYVQASSSYLVMLFSGFLQAASFNKQVLE
jgi:hypothetical protein